MSFQKFENWQKRKLMCRICKSKMLSVKYLIKQFILHYLQLCCCCSCLHASHANSHGLCLQPRPHYFLPPSSWLHHMSKFRLTAPNSGAWIIHFVFLPVSGCQLLWLNWFPEFGVLCHLSTRPQVVERMQTFCFITFYSSLDANRLKLMWFLQRFLWPVWL